MSSLARSRSLRKPSNERSQRGRSSTDAGNQQSTVSVSSSTTITSTNPTRTTTTTTSPSKLKQPSNYGASRIESDARSKSSNEPARTTQARSFTIRPPLTSDNKRATTRTGGARTPTDASSSITPRVAVSRQPSISDSNNNKRPSTRSGETQAANTSLQRRPSTKQHQQHQQHARTISASSSAPTTTASSHTRHISNPSNPNSIQKHILPHPSRPAFTTHQQHFSPAKSLAPKPPTSTFLAPPTPSKHPANVALSAETARLQAELLQLHLLHRSVDDVVFQWRESARDVLEKRFEEVKARHGVLIGDERDLIARATGEALWTWSGAGEPMGRSANHAPAGGASLAWGSSLALEDKAIMLDEVVTGVWSLSEPPRNAKIGNGASKYGKVVRKFEKWLAGVEEVWSSRGLDNKKEEEGIHKIKTPLFIDPIDQTWKDEVATLTRKLGGWKENLSQLQLVSSPVVSTSASESSLRENHHQSHSNPSSPLERTITKFTRLVDGMLSELGVMSRLERDTMRREREWIREAVLAEEEESETETETVGAVWRRVPGLGLGRGFGVDPVAV